MSASRSLYTELLAIGKDAVQKLDSHPIGARLVQGTLLRSEYVEYLVQVVHQVRRTSPMLQAAARGLRKRGRPELAALFDVKAAEEMGHDEWALRDLAELGVRREWVESLPSSAAVDAYVAWAAYCASQAPVAVLGVAWVLEWFGYARAGRAATNLVAHSGIARVESAVTFLRGHGDADQDHVRVLAAALDTITDPDQWALVQLSARLTTTLYLGFFEIRDNADARNALSSTPPVQSLASATDVASDG